MPKQRKRRGSQWQSLKKPGPGDGVVIGYVRYSSINQDPRSIAEQKVRIEQKVATYGWRVARFAEEPEESASYDDLDSRPVFKSLLLDDAGQTCNVIMCDESSRWARSEEIGYMSLRILREKGCWWETASDDWDINKPLSEGGSIMWGIALSQNASYSRKMSYHSRKGKMAKAREGYSNSTPIYGYHTPALPIEPTATVQDLQRMRRRIVYEPHPVHFAGLQKIGELAAQQHPILWHSAIANELNRLQIPYHIQRGIRDEWTPVRVAMVLRSHYPREFVAGGGKGTIQLPDGEDVEGLHVAAWPFEQWQHIVENQRIAGGRPPRNKQSNIAPLQNLLTCSHCGHTMRYRDTVQRKRDVTHLYSYYVCLDRLTDPCPAHEGRRHGLWIPVPAVHRQFRHLLELFGTWLPDALEYMKAEYARSDAGEGESVLEYQAKKAQLASRKKKIDDK